MRTERYFTLRLRAIWRPRLSASRLCYTIHTECQYQGIVKVPGSFRPSALNEHLYSYCNFAELLVETVGKSLRHSGVSAYTAACAFACTCVFGKQSLPPGLCHPQKLPQQVCSPSGVSLKPKERE